MRRKSAKIRNRKDYRKNFAVLPVVFFLCGYLLIYFAVLPVVQPLLTVYSLAFTGVTSDYSEGDADCIFTQETGITGGTLKGSEFHYPNYGECFGNIKIEGTNIDCGLYLGDMDKELKKGACNSTWTGIPGSGTTTMISAHNYLYFRDLQPSAEVGATVNIETHYGSYVYRIVDMKLAKATDESAYISYLGAEGEYLIVYTCQMENGISMSQNRYYVFCEYVSGPLIDFSK